MANPAHIASAAPVPVEFPDIYVRGCPKCGQLAGCNNEHVVIDLAPESGARRWQGYSLNSVLYIGKNVVVPKEAADEMLCAVNRWKMGN